MKSSLPFTILRKSRSPYYYVRLRDDRGNEISCISTKETDYNKAVVKGWKIYSLGTKKTNAKVKINQAEITSDDVQYYMEEFKKRGLIQSYTITSSNNNMKAVDYILSFWNEEESNYLKSKKRHNQGVHKKHLMNNISRINRYWLDILKDKTLGQVDRNDIQMMFDRLDETELNGNTKNHIIRSVLTPLKYAYNNEFIDRDLSSGWVFYKPVYQKRNILTKEMAKALFSQEWHNKAARIASMLSMCTGMRQGEILSLSLKDIGEDCIYVNNSYSQIDKLKSTKNGESRTEQLPFKSLIFDLLELGNTNPYTTGYKYIFYSTIPDKPMESKILLRELRRELCRIGLTEEESKMYTFHSWRHFYTSYMKGKIEDKLLQSQTGHKTLSMLEHYGNHILDGDIEKIQNAQLTIFGDIIS